MTAGKGDMLVWASKDGKFGYAKLSFGKDHELVVKMDKTAGGGHAVDLNLCRPRNAELPAVTPEQRAANDRRMVHEDSIRNAYVSMFMTDETARYFARRYKLDEDAVSRILVASRGNHRVIADFMARLRSESPKRRSGPAPTDFGKRPPRRYTGSSDGPHAIPYVQECRPFPQICAQSTRKQRDADPL